MTSTNKKISSENFDKFKNNFADIKKRLIDTLDAFEEKQLLEVQKVSEILYETFKVGKKVIWCGNGGSASQADHLASEFVGRYKLRDRKPLNSISLTSNNALLTAIGNDYCYEDIFSRQLKAIANQGDSLVVLSTSGKSPNILKSIKVGKELGLNVISIFGIRNEEIENNSDICININSPFTSHIQELHLFIGHLICEYIDQRIYYDQL